MTLFTSFYRLLRNTLQHLIRNPWHSSAAILVMTLTFFVTLIFSVVAFGAETALKYLENKPQVIVYFCDATAAVIEPRCKGNEADEEYILALKKGLEQQDFVSQVKYVSKLQALDIYKELVGADSSLTEFVTADILPASLEVSTTGIENLEKITTLLLKDPRIEKVQFQKDVVEKLQTLTRNLRLIGLSLIAFLAVVSVLIVLVVVSMNMESFSKEIEIMRLVGASTRYIRWPFLLDGAILGLISAALAAGAMYLILPYLKSLSGGLFVDIDILPLTQDLITKLWLGVSLAGVILGMVGSSIAIWRHLRV